MARHAEWYKYTALDGWDDIDLDNYVGSLYTGLSFPKSM